MNPTLPHEIAEPQDRRARPRFQMEAQITATSQDNFYCGFT